MPNIYIPEDIFKMYVEKYGYTEAKTKIQDVLRESIIVEQRTVSKSGVG